MYRSRKATRNLTYDPHASSRCTSSNVSPSFRRVTGDNTLPISPNSHPCGQAFVDTSVERSPSIHSPLTPDSVTQTIQVHEEQLHENDTPNAIGGSGGGSGKIVKDFVKFIDVEGNRTRRYGKISPADIWDLNGRQKMVVDVNEMYQPIRRSGHIFNRWLADLADRPELCPYHKKDWRKVNKATKEELKTIVRAKFHLPPRSMMDKYFLSNLGIRVRSKRSELKAKYCPPGATIDQVLEKWNVAKIPKEQWYEMVEYWFSNDGKDASKRGEEARSEASHFHTRGTKSFAIARDEYIRTNGREPGDIDMFILNHKRRDGSYSRYSKSKEFVDEAMAYIKEKTGHSELSENTIEAEKEAVLSLYGKNHSGRAFSYGHGATPSKLEMCNKSVGRSNLEIERLNKELAAAREEAATAREEAAATKDQLQKTEEQLAATRAEVAANKKELDVFMARVNQWMGRTSPT